MNRRPHLAGELAIVAVLLLVYDRIRDLAPIRRDAALAHADSVLHLEGRPHLAVESAANQWLTQHHLLSLAAGWYYQLAHVTVAMGVLAYCYARRPGSYRRARNALVMTNALAIFWWYPLAPPRLTSHGFVDTAGQVGSGLLSEADPFAAMPSLHVAWAVWAAVVAAGMCRNPLTRMAWVGYPVLTTAVVVASANHYLLDVAMGATLALSALAVPAGHRVITARPAGAPVRTAARGPGWRHEHG